MSVWLVTRHPGAHLWLQQQGVVADHVATHLDLNQIQTGDDVIGILPFHLAAAVVAKQGRYFSLDVNIPPHLRGVELSAETLYELGAKITRYHVREV